MTFFQFWSATKNMLKHDFLGVKQAEKHAGADGLVIFGLKMDL